MNRLSSTQEGASDKMAPLVYVKNDEDKLLTETIDEGLMSRCDPLIEESKQLTFSMDFFNQQNQYLAEQQETSGNRTQY